MKNGVAEGVASDPHDTIKDGTENKTTISNKLLQGVMQIFAKISILNHFKFPPFHQQAKTKIQMKK